MQLLGTVELLFFAQRGIFEGSVLSRQSAPMTTMQLPFFMEYFQILTNGDLGGPKPVGTVKYQYPAFALKSSTMARLRSSLNTRISPKTS